MYRHTVECIDSLSVRDNNNRRNQDKMSYNPFVSQDQQDDDSNYFQPSAFQGCSDLDEQEYEMYREEEALEAAIEEFAELRGLKYQAHCEGLQKLYFAWLKATQPKPLDK